MLLLTTDRPDNLVVVSWLGVVFGVATHPLSPYETGVKGLGTFDRNPRGGTTVSRPELLTIMARMRDDALRALHMKAIQRGANGVLALRFDHRQVTPVWVEICAYGTAVVFDQPNP